MFPSTVRPSNVSYTLTNHEDGAEEQPLVVVVAHQVEVRGDGARHLGAVVHEAAVAAHFGAGVEEGGH